MPLRPRWRLPAAPAQRGGRPPRWFSGNEWRIWNALEVKDEAEQLRVAKSLRQLVEEGRRCPGVQAQAPVDLFDAITSRLDLLSVEVDESSFHLPPELTPDSVHDLLQFFARGGRLQRRYLERLLAQAYALLQAAPTVAVVRPPSPQHEVIVVGDLHGSLEDLTTILEAHGPPGPRRTYVFNGDFVDRGANGVEVVLTLLALKVAHPDHVHLNRGNHEDELVATMYGFQSEVLAKYGSEGVFDLFTLVFAQLPFAVVIKQYAFVVHGGLSRQDFTIDSLAAVPRGPELLTLARHFTEEQPLGLLQDLVWSDPRRGQSGTVYNTARNAGCFFGVDTAREWLKRHGLRFLVRSHQCVEEGYARLDCGDGTAVYTVFSASHYPARRGTNVGAVLRCRDAARDPEPVPHVGAAGAAEDPQAVSKRTLVELICRHKAPLQRAFERASNQELIGIDRWAAIMRDETGLDLDWRKLQPILGGATGKYDPVQRKVVPAPFVNWRQFLNAFQVEFQRGGGKSAITGSVVSALYSNRTQLMLLFRFLDRDRSNTLHLAEFRDGCALLNSRLPPDERIDAEQLFRLMDLDHSGEINLNEFCEAFRICHPSASPPPTP